MSETYVRATRYDVSVFPDEMLDDPASALAADTWGITVEWRGMGNWAVCRMSRCLSRAGEWDIEPRPSSRDDDWLAAHRFERDEAIYQARVHAPRVTVNGYTALDILARHTSQAAP